MGHHIIKMPDIGEGIAEVELVEWHVKVGDTVSEDQVLADVMTDKATVEVPSPVNGKVLALGGAVGDVLAVGTELIRLEVEGAGHAEPILLASRGGSGTPPPRVEVPVESAPVLTQAAALATVPTTPSTHTTPPAAQQTQKPTSVPLAATHTAARAEGEKPLASPAVRQRAWDLGIELQFVPGSGPAGQITHGDLDIWLAGSTSATTSRSTASLYAQRSDEQVIPIVGMRRKIAQKMQESKRHIPHFTYVEEIDVTELEQLRQQLNTKWAEARGKLTMLPLLVRAMVLALREFPQINARFDDEAGSVTRYGAVHLGIAAQTDAGLMVPVVHHAEALDPWSCAAEVARLAQATRNGKIARDELMGSTITLTSLGALGGIVSTPVINYPEVAIVGVNRIVERPMVQHGAIVIRKMMNLSSSFDHRVVDGMHAAEFVQCIRRYLECPALLFVE
ncbi:MAG: dihydrolipoamide acetyltransferase family protein [Herbaspirillum sp.]